MSERINSRNERDTPEREKAPNLSPAIWAGSLADYNAGNLHGEWIDAAVPTDELHHRVQQMLAKSREHNAEEWGIFDYDNFGPYRVGEYEPLESVAAVARGIAEHGPAFAAWIALHPDDPEAHESFEDAFYGTYDSREAWAEEFLDSVGVQSALDEYLPEWITPLVRLDIDRFARDSDLSGDITVESAPDGQVYVFDGRL